MKFAPHTTEKQSYTFIISEKPRNIRNTNIIYTYKYTHTDPESFVSEFRSNISPRKSAKNGTLILMYQNVVTY